MTEDQASGDDVYDSLLSIINTVRAHKELPPWGELRPEMRMREDVGFESLDLAELMITAGEGGTCMLLNLGHALSHEAFS